MDTCNNLDASQTHDAEWKKADAEGLMTHTVWVHSDDILEKAELWDKHISGCMRLRVERGSG